MTSSSAQDGNEACLPKTSGAGGQTDFPRGGDEPTPDIFGDPPADDWVWRHNLEDIKTLCSVGLSPRMMSGFIMRILKNHFSDPALILTPNLKQFIYSDDFLASEIRIVKSTFFDPVNSGQFPALVVRRLPFQSQRHSMDDRTSGYDATGDALRGVSRHSRFISGAHRIFCIAEVDGESEDLAQEVFDVLSFLSPAIVERLPFHDFQVTGMGEQGDLSDASALGVPVDITYAYEYAWSLQALAPRLKTVSLELP